MTPTSPIRSSEPLAAEARRLGFTQVRVAALAPPLPMAGFDAMIASGRHGPLGWLATSRDDRSDPRRLLPGCRSVVALGIDYGWPVPPDPGGLTGRVARYAWGRDYHNTVLRRVRKLQRWLGARGVDSYASVDSRPVYERAWAARAGLGYAGRNGCAIVPAHTSYFFLATLLVDAAWAADAPLPDHCGRCRRCVDACPTDAILPAGGLDAARCLSTWTIEVDDAMPEALRPRAGRWVFGCDDCQDVCPHVRDGLAGHPDFAPVHAWLDLVALLDAPPDALLTRFEGTPLRRAAPWRLKRNAALVLGNLGDPAARPALLRVADRRDPLGETARWALDRLGTRAAATSG